MSSNEQAGAQRVRAALSLDGEWAFRPGAAPDGVDPRREPGGERIVVPGLWEAQGHVDLDGEAWYLRTFEMASTDGWWALRFGAVMDEADVYLNGVHAGHHLGGYTPFELDVTGLVVEGANTLAVRVIDHPLDGWDHVRTAHGKQGWMNHVFPSPPSLYATYGGIWQSVDLVRHGPVRIADLWVDGDPDTLRTVVELANRGPDVLNVRVRWQIDGSVGSRDVVLRPGRDDSVEIALTDLRLEHWSPASPALHRAEVSVEVAGEVSDARTERFGVRRVSVVADRILIDGEPVRLAAALVQGFRGDTLYAEGTRAQIEAEVAAAKAAGLNMLRLHIKAFDPVYLDVCDELGMLVHCDIPVAEPIAHDELGATGVVAERSAAAATEQVRRDRNHPSIVLWSAMNELGAENTPIRLTPGYEAFVRHVYDAVRSADHTRPIIENDWVEPDPAHVYASPILTAHWYGRLSTAYLCELWAKMQATAQGDRPFLLSEFGDWGLPDVAAAPEGVVPGAEPPFWWPADLWSALADLPWGGDATAFVRGTQRYQGIADRLQIEMCRATPGVAGWCVTELTDVPHEYNGLWHLDRTPKTAALDQVSGAARPVLPVLLPVTPPFGAASEGTLLAFRGSWSGWAGEAFAMRLLVVNDTAQEGDVEVDVEVDGVLVERLGAHVEPHRVAACGVVAPLLPTDAGPCEVRVTVRGLGAAPVVSSYRVHGVARRPNGVPGAIEVLGSTATRDALRAVGAGRGNGLHEGGLLVVGEGCLDDVASAAVRRALADGRPVLVLAQPADAVGRLPVHARAVDIATEWGSTPFLFSGSEPLLDAVPRDSVLTTELLSVVPDVVYTELDGQAWAARLLIGMHKPFPGQVQGTVVGSVDVGNGRLWVCQLPLEDAVRRDDPTASSILADLVAAVDGVLTGVEHTSDVERLGT